MLRAGHGQLLPRQAALKAGIPDTANGYAVDMVCSSGMMSVINAATAIACGEADIVLAGGLESMSQSGFFLSHRTLSGGETWRYPEAPIQTVKKLLDKLNLQISDFDLFENNEAFALSNVLFHRILGVPHEKLNVYGGAIALGHPIGASGARILVTLLNALEGKNGHLGLASVCHGTGGGTALAIERLH